MIKQEGSVMVTLGEMEEFEKAAMPLILWLKENKHPHYHALVTSQEAQLMEGIMGVRPAIYEEKTNDQ